MRCLAAAKSVSNEFPRRPLLVFRHPAEGAFTGSAVLSAWDRHIQDIAVLVDCPPKISAVAANHDEHLIHMPDVSASALAPTARVRGPSGNRRATATNCRCCRGRGCCRRQTRRERA